MVTFSRGAFVAASAAPSASTSASAAPEEAPDEVVQNNLAGTIDTDGPPAPCDFARSYRGKVGEDALSVVLSRASSTLRGSSAYDAGFGDIELAGTLQPDGTLTLAERKDGKDTAVLRGRCASDTGVITGTWTQGSVNRPFTWRPREAGGAPLAQRARRIERKAKDATSAGGRCCAPACSSRARRRRACGPGRGRRRRASRPASGCWRPAG